MGLGITNKSFISKIPDYRKYSNLSTATTATTLNQSISSSVLTSIVKSPRYQFSVDDSEFSNPFGHTSNIFSPKKRNLMLKFEKNPKRYSQFSSLPLKNNENDPQTPVNSGNINALYLMPKTCKDPELNNSPKSPIFDSPITFKNSS
ncbi:hypothetical protein AYI68_g1508 [Smittium mucronatum]|uniref:Uncharacterized protein n=1 Tax=Smittium mucronatum TaxID=133383 RepID=A0A1R0H5B5_9FUNG|nr:hypothetical protein AYI68_g1508 [Smittium mucronatum]